MDQSQAKFEGWAVIGNAAMFQLDVPELPEREYVLARPEWGTDGLIPAGSTVTKELIAGRTRLINPSAVYALNPCTEEAARKAIDAGARREIKIIKLAEGKQLVQAIPEPEEYEDVDVDMEEEETIG
jgi:hypothetical protein